MDRSDGGKGHGIVWNAARSRRCRTRREHSFHGTRIAPISRSAAEVRSGARVTGIWSEEP